MSNVCSLLCAFLLLFYFCRLVNLRVPDVQNQSLESRIASGALPTNLDDANTGRSTASPPSSPPPLSSSSPTAISSSPTKQQQQIENATINTAVEAAGDLPTAEQDTNNNIKTNIIPVSSASSQRALSVLDGMAVCEVAWYEGGSLPETLYVCLYLHPPAFCAVLEGLGWVVPELRAVGGVHPKLDLKIKEGSSSFLRDGKVLLFGKGSISLAV